MKEENLKFGDEVIVWNEKADKRNKLDNRELAYFVGYTGDEKFPYLVVKYEDLFFAWGTETKDTVSVPFAVNYCEKIEFTKEQRLEKLKKVVDLMLSRNLGELIKYFCDGNFEEEAYLTSEYRREAKAIFALAVDAMLKRFGV